ncbi:MAG: hypothetical protein JWR17_4674 [Pseudomonas sp.]|nr:hypothetical protein [Pseudomonas sp.]
MFKIGRLGVRDSFYLLGHPLNPWEIGGDSFYFCFPRRLAPVFAGLDATVFIP